MKRLFLLLSFIISTACLAADPYLLLDRLLDRDRIPRILSTVDFGLSSIQPEALLPLEADFDGDGARDMAISGVYTLPGEGGDYFILVVSGSEKRDAKKAFLKTGRTPFYLHKAGSTGASDPGTQAFSFSPCVNCSTGTDVRFDPETRAYTETAWLPGARLPVATTAYVEVDPQMVDVALKVAGSLRDVKVFVDEVGRRGSDLVTRVEPVSDATVRVLIFEKFKGGEEKYDAIEVNTRTRRIVRRERSSRRAPAKPAEPDTAR